MEYRTLDLKIISAKALKNVNLLSKMDVYAVVYIAGGDSRAKQKTPVDREGGRNPSWNFPMKFTIDEYAAQQNRLTLVINLRAERVLGDKDVGEVRVPIKQFIGENKKTVQFVSYQVRKPSGKPQGELNFSYQLSEKVGGGVYPAPPPVAAKSDEPVTAYPAPPMAVAGTSSVYPPPPYQPPYTTAPASSGYYPPPAEAYPPSGYSNSEYPKPAPATMGYGYPPQQQYGGYYPPPPQSYGYPPQQGYYPAVQQPPKKNKFGGGGLGLGAGLLGGALGGLLIGDMISDAGSYDAGGFDF